MSEVSLSQGLSNELVNNPFLFLLKARTPNPWVWSRGVKLDLSILTVINSWAAIRTETGPNRVLKKVFTALEATRQPTISTRWFKKTLKYSKQTQMKALRKSWTLRLRSVYRAISRVLTIVLKDQLQQTDVRQASIQQDLASILNKTDVETSQEGQQQTWA